jgi:hypothetical protein
VVVDGGYEMNSYCHHEGVVNCFLFAETNAGFRASGGHDNWLHRCSTSHNVPIPRMLFSLLDVSVLKTQVLANIEPFSIFQTVTFKSSASRAATSSLPSAPLRK